ncbi:hypothetical protein ACWEO2_42315 [Nocardia sp. NPDC004278]
MSCSASTRTRQERTIKHRIIVLGAGYAGAFSATSLARQLHSDDFEIIVVNAEPDFVERLRLHQLAAGQDLRHRPLAKVFAGTDIQLRLARVTSVDAEHRTVTVTDGEGIGRVVDDDARAKPGALRSRTAARVTSAIINTAAWAVSHPTFGKPNHKYRLATTREHSPHVVAGHIQSAIPLTQR